MNTALNDQLFRKIQSRRSFFRETAGGIGTIALAQLLQQEGRAAEAGMVDPLAPRKPHFARSRMGITTMTTTLKAVLAWSHRPQCAALFVGLEHLQ